MIADVDFLIAEVDFMIAYVDLSIFNEFTVLKIFCSLDRVFGAIAASDHAIQSCYSCKFTDSINRLITFDLVRHGRETIQLRDCDTRDSYRGWTGSAEFESWSAMHKLFHNHKSIMRAVHHNGTVIILMMLSSKRLYSTKASA